MIKDLAVVIVTYNAETWIIPCVKSFLSEGVSEDRIVIVDNNSGDDTLKIIKAEFKEIKVFALGENIGFGAANNIGITTLLNKECHTVLLVNQDVVMLSGSINAMLAASNQFPSSIISPVHLANDSGDLDFLYSDYYKKSQPIGIGCRKSEFINAAIWMVPVQIFKVVGLFDPLFHHYGEDRDFANRMKYHGFNFIIAEEAKAVHGRPQYTSFNDIPVKKRWMFYKIGLLVELKNINTPFWWVLGKIFYTNLRGLFGSARASNWEELTMQWQTLVFLLSRLPKVISHRQISKGVHAFGA